MKFVNINVLSLTSSKISTKAGMAEPRLNQSVKVFNPPAIIPLKILFRCFKLAFGT